MLFLQEQFCLNIYCGNILLHLLLETKIFFLTTYYKFAIKNNPFMQLRLIICKTVNKNKLKVWKFLSHRLSGFSAVKETVTRVEGRR